MAANRSEFTGGKSTWEQSQKRNIAAQLMIGSRFLRGSVYIPPDIFGPNIRPDDWPETGGTTEPRRPISPSDIGGEALKLAMSS